MDWLLYAVVLPLALFALALAACAFHWAVKHDQVRELWLTIRSYLGRPTTDETERGLLSPSASRSSRAPSQS